MGAMKDDKRYERYKKGFALRFRKTCAARDMTNYSKLARAIKTSPSAVYSYAHAERLPSAYTISKIAVVLGVDANYLLGIKRKDSDEDC